MSGLAYIHNLASDLSVWTVAGSHAKPQFKWTYSDTDGQPQARFRVRIYDAASAGNLVHDSGEVVSGATTYDANYAMPNGDQANSERWWTLQVYDGMEWSAESTRSGFKVLWAQAIYETAALPVPSASWAFASTKAGNGQIALFFATATGAAGVGRGAWVTDIGALIPAVRLNVMVRMAHQSGTVPSIADMTFSYLASSGQQPDNWDRSPSATGFSLGSDVVRFGSQALKCVVSTAVNHWIRPFRIVSGDHMPVKGKTTYVLSAYVKTDHPFTGTNRLRLIVYPQGGAVPIPALNVDPDLTLPAIDRNRDFETQTTVGKGDRDWQRLHYVFTTDADTTEIDPYIEYVNDSLSVTNDIWYADGVQLESGEVVTAWSPGQIGAGAAALDAQGVQINALEGGILRLKAGSGDRDLVELGDHGLLLGGDTDLSSPSAGMLALGGVPLLGLEGMTRTGMSCTPPTGAVWTKATGGTAGATGPNTTFNAARNSIVLAKAGIYLVVYGGRWASVSASTITQRVGYSIGDNADPTAPGIRTQMASGFSPVAPQIVSGAGVEVLGPNANICLWANNESGTSRNFDQGYLHVLKIADLP